MDTYVNLTIPYMQSFKWKQFLKIYNSIFIFPSDPTLSFIGLRFLNLSLLSGFNTAKGTSLLIFGQYLSKIIVAFIKYLTYPQTP